MRPPRAGATLVEMVVVISVLGVLSVFLAMAIFQGARTYVDLRSRSASVADAQHALDLMARDLQEIRSATAGDIPTFSATALSFTDIQASSLAYSFSGSTLTRNGFTLLDRLSAFSFSYFKKDGTAAAAAADIWTVEISCTIRRSDRDLVLRTRVFPRNFTPKMKTWLKT